jgi:hypothetical protein
MSCLTTYKVFCCVDGQVNIKNDLGGFVRMTYKKSSGLDGWIY